MRYTTQQASDNELASARLACDVLNVAAGNPGRVDAVANMIEATAGHTDSSTCDADDLSTAVLLAADLAVLAADPSGLQRLRQRRRFEYSHVRTRSGHRQVSRAAQLHRSGSHLPEALELHDWEGALEPHSRRTRRAEPARTSGCGGLANARAPELAEVAGVLRGQLLRQERHSPQDHRWQSTFSQCTHVPTSKASACTVT